MGKFSRLTYDNRLQIGAMLHGGHSAREIANAIGVHISTVYREINRGSVAGGYDPDFSQAEYEKMMQEAGRPSILEEDTELAKYISHLILDEGLSPEEVHNTLINDDRHPSLAYGTIYNSIDSGLIPNVTRDSLKPRSTKIFNDGQIRIPNWIKDELKWADGDVLDITFDVESKTLTFKKR
ncbi:MAG: helix-turn-helix domain-containing protein [Oribacterium sp.]|nr:helix-turn-helix domain-containing protein [Oribacterium sp.]